MSSNATAQASASVTGPPVAAALVEALDFDSLYEEQFAFVWRSVRRLGVPECQVDDAVQEVFIVVHRRMAAFEGRSSIRSWLYGIVANVVRDHRRTARRKDPRIRGGGEGPDVEALPDAGRCGPHESLERADAVRVLHELLAALDFPKREAFVLVELEQMSIPEVAEATGTNANTVYSRLRAARKAFNDAVTRYRTREERRAG